ncbi:MAG TPA: ABC transporter permease [Candidatus Dormibacteraeota bacterium]
MGAERAAAPLMLDREVAGLHALDEAEGPRRSLLVRAWSAVWPQLAAVAAVIAAWQVVAWSGWRPDYLLPGPVPVFLRLSDDIRHPAFAVAVSITMQRALLGYAIAVLIGALTGGVVARNSLLRRACGSLITGLQSMPSIAWFPLAILLFGLSETAILFVVLLGAAPAVANGLISGIDQIPPLLIRCGTMLGARGLRLYWHVVLPASLPAFLGGLKQGWAFAWRSLMAGELLVILGNRPSVGYRLQVARDFSDAEGLLATMLVILLIGMAVDVAFTLADRAVRRRWGLTT